jgi:hypothetical protein
MRVFGCAKFKRLANEELDRELSSGEVLFMEKHRGVCMDCDEVQSQSSLAMNFLRAGTLEVDVNPQFEERVIRKLRIQTTRESIRYWSPAVAGAFIAGLAVIAALQMITRSADLPHTRFINAESHRITTARPDLNQNIPILPPK